MLRPICMLLVLWALGEPPLSPAVQPSPPRSTKRQSRSVPGGSSSASPGSVRLLSRNQPVSVRLRACSKACRVNPGPRTLSPSRPNCSTALHLGCCLLDLLPLWCPATRSPPCSPPTRPHATPEPKGGGSGGGRRCGRGLSSPRPSPRSSSGPRWGWRPCAWPAPQPWPCGRRGGASR